METDFLDLEESNQFLRQLLDNINSAIFIVDHRFRIHRCNKGFFNLFGSEGLELSSTTFGEASGCINSAREAKPCCETSACSDCQLNRLLTEVLPREGAVEKKLIRKVFYIDGRPALKYLELTARPVKFHGQSAILAMLYDITEHELKTKTLKKQQQQFHEDLVAAASLQQALLPDKNLPLSGIATAWRFIPSHHIGGDLFHIQELQGGIIRLYCLDVCGHGISAALVAVTVSQFLSGLHNRMRLAGRLFSPGQVMQRLDRAFPMERFDRFFSIAYASLDTASGELCYSNAGHMPPLVMRKNGGLEILDRHGAVIGAGLDVSDREGMLLLYPGDRFCLHTDGLVENFGKDGERTGRNDFYRMLQKKHALPLDQVVETLFKSVVRPDPTDDMSLLMIEVDSPPAVAEPQASRR